MKTVKTILLVSLSLTMLLLFFPRVFSQNSSVLIISYFDEQNQITNTIEGNIYGSKVSFSNELSSEEGYSFAFWIVNGVVRTDLPLDYEFLVTYDTELIGVFRPNDKYAAVFMDSNGRMLDIQYVFPSASASEPEISLPTKPGYVIASPAWDKTLTNIQGNTVFVLQYQKNTTEQHSVSITNGSGSGSYGYNTYATAVANEPGEGQYFNYWVSGNNIVSTEAIYTFTVLDDISLEAVFSTTDNPDLPYVSLSSNIGLRVGYKSYLGRFYLPEGYELIEHGLITSTGNKVIDLSSSGITRYQSNKYNADTNEFLISILSDTIVSSRAYLVVRDADGNLRTFYNEFVEGEASELYADDLFFSCYLEGSSNNKALAVFNGTGNTVDLGDYSIKLYANGTTTATNTLTMSGSLAHGGVYVIANSSANQTILNMSDTTSAVTNFNGNDALELIRSGAIVDSIGQVGFDPGEAWSNNGVSTLNMTLKRKTSVSSGRTSSTSAFDPSLEWDGYAQDTTIGLDQHTMAGGTAPVSVSSIEAFIPDMSYEQGESIDLTGAFIKVYYSNGVSTIEDVASGIITGFSTTTVGNYFLTVAYEGKTSELKYEVKASSLPSALMIYEVYGGGGNSGATYNYDYVVLYNGSTSSINLTGYSLQYASATSSSSWTNIVSLSGTIPSKTYYFIRLGTNNPLIGSPLDVPYNILGDINLAASSGKVALVDNTEGITGISDENVVDFLGYGTANEAETMAASGLNNTNSLKRSSFVDSDDNSADFALETANLGYYENSLVLSSISVANLQRYYEQGDPLVIGGAKVILNYTNGAIELIDLTSEMVTNFSTSTEGTYQMTITYGTKQTLYEYYVIDYSNVEGVDIHYIDLGYSGGGPGEAALIKIGAIDILIDAGENGSESKNALLTFLAGHIDDGTIEYVIATHQDADHIGGMDVVYANYVVENTILYSTPSSIATTLRNNFEAAVAAEGGNTYYVIDLVNGNDTIEIVSGVELVFYNTSYLTTADANASSIVFTLEAFDTRVLFNGDAEGNQEAVYASLVGDVDIFKMGHHGAMAGTTAYLLETIMPEIAIVTNGDYLGNSYSHPTYSALSRIYTYSDLCPVYAVTGGNGASSDIMLDRNGDIKVSITPAGYEITSQYYGMNPMEMSNTAYWNDANNPHRSLGYYYADATGILDSGLLKAALNDIISGHTYVSYDGVWNALRTTDADPDNPNNVLLFYTNRSQSNTENGGNSNQWNREHVWAQSHGIDGSYPGYSDLHHIRATDVTVNSARGDLDFSNVSPHDGSTKVTTAYGYGDISTYNYKNSSYFEPRDEIKGDVARMLFYMATRYEGEGGEPDLELVNGTTSSTSNNLGDLATLLLWHIQDPVDERELIRNEAVFGIQGNRNPYIDNPEYATIVFGGGS